MAKSGIKFGFPYTARVQKALNLAREEAQSLNCSYIDTEHILLGLLREDDGVAASVLKNLGVDIGRAREEILKNLDPNADGGADAKRQSKVEKQNWLRLLWSRWRR